MTRSKSYCRRDFRLILLLGLLSLLFVLPAHNAAASIIIDLRAIKIQGHEAQPGTVDINDIVIAVGSDIMSDFNQAQHGSILLNINPTDFTATWLAACGDRELLVPVAIFNGRGYTGSTVLTLSAMPFRSDDGGAAWATFENDSSFGPGDTTMDPPDQPSKKRVPEPTSLVTLAGLSLCAAGARAWQRRRQKRFTRDDLQRLVEAEWSQTN